MVTELPQETSLSLESDHRCLLLVTAARGSPEPAARPVEPHTDSGVPAPYRGCCPQRPSLCTPGLAHTQLPLPPPVPGLTASGEEANKPAAAEGESWLHSGWTVELSEAQRLGLPGRWLSGLPKVPTQQHLLHKGSSQDLVKGISQGSHPTVPGWVGK